MTLLRIWVAFFRLGLVHIWPWVAIGIVLACVARFFRLFVIGARVARSEANIALSRRLLASVHTFRFAVVTV